MNSFERSGSAPTTKQAGDAGEDAALAFLQDQGLRLLVRNYRTPGRGGGEIDLIMRAPDTTLVFVEVRRRRSTSHSAIPRRVQYLRGDGGGGTSIGE